MWPLRIVGILYLLSGLWCTFQYKLAANYVGYVLSSPKGEVEFLSVYGGIQVGLALAALYFSFRPEQLKVASIFTLFISAGLLTYRVASMSLLGSGPALISMLVIEALIVVMLIYQIYRVNPI